MAHLNLDLPEPTKELLLRKAAEKGFASPGEFVAALLQLCGERETLESQLLAAVDEGEFEEVTPEFWSRLRAHAAASTLIDSALCPRTNC